MLLTLFALVGIGFSLYILISAVLMDRFVQKELANPVKDHERWPKVALVAPCKDLDPDFEKNMRMLMVQDYPNYEIFFATVDEEDPTYPILSKLAQESTVPARVVLGGFTKQRCQKLDNMIAALETMSDDIEIYAFVDSDSRVSHHWLRHLVHPLIGNEEVGATTGYRWYIPEKQRWITYLLCLWTGFQITNFYNNKTVSAWGGSMAMTSKCFAKLKVREKWEYALADDCILNDCVRKAGLGMVFVSRCMTSSSSDYPLSTILVFATRQAIIGKFTLTPIWVASTIALAGIHTVLFTGIYQLATALMHSLPIPWTTWGMVAFAPAGIIQAAIVIHTINRLTQERHEADPLGGQYWWAMFAPFAYLFLWLTLTMATFSNRFEWRQIYYHMISPIKTKVYKYPERFQ